MSWTLKSQGNVILTMPRSAVIRSFVLNHIIHRRAITRVYLRLNEVPIAGMYGPSGDELLGGLLLSRAKGVTIRRGGFFGSGIACTAS